MQSTFFAEPEKSRFIDSGLFVFVALLSNLKEEGWGRGAGGGPWPGGETWAGGRPNGFLMEYFNNVFQ